MNELVVWHTLKDFFSDWIWTSTDRNEFILSKFATFATIPDTW